MKEIPILFNTEMVRAVLSGRKTQTRRVVNMHPDCHDANLGLTPTLDGLDLHDASCPEEGILGIKCPYGQIGDRLWVRETHTLDEADPNGVLYRADLPDVEAADVIEVYKGSWIPSVLMKREFSRILLEVTNVTVERVQGISEQDAINEGIRFNLKGSPDNYPDIAPSDVFKCLWDSIYSNKKDKEGKRLPYSWGENPWVWAVEFKVLEVKGGRDEQ